MPMVALQLLESSTFLFEGSFTVVLSPRRATTVAKLPELLAIFPPSPGLNSRLHIMVLSGINPKGRTFPTFASASEPMEIT